MHFEMNQSLTPPYGGFPKRRGARFKVAKTTFNAENFIRRLSLFISNDFSVVHS